METNKYNKMDIVSGGLLTGKYTISNDSVDLINTGNTNTAISFIEKNMKKLKDNLFETRYSYPSDVLKPLYTEKMNNRKLLLL